MGKNTEAPESLARRLTSDSEIQAVFDSLGLSDERDRVRYLSLNWTHKDAEVVTRPLYTTRLSNNSEPIEP